MTIRPLMAAALACALTATVVAAPTARSAAPETTTLIGVRAPGTKDPYTLGAMATWQGKPNAVGLFFRQTDVPAADVVAKMASIWDAGSVPAYSVEPVDPNAQVAAGAVDASIDAVARAIKVWLAGPNHVYGDDDDRRAFIRLAHEANGSWYEWAPCHALGGTPADYRAMWRHYHDRYTRLGIDRTHVAWIFSVNQTDSAPRCAAESLYPGDAYVDWTGVDGYTRSRGKAPSAVFGPMTARLRKLAPSKPVSIDEAGASVARVSKSAYIAAYFDWLRTSDIRMALWFNIDKAHNPDWAVFGGALGDEVFRSRTSTFRAWHAYRVGVADPRIVGAARTNPRLLTDALFLGQ